MYDEVKLIGTYKFALVFEFINKTDWVTFQLSQALLGGIELSFRSLEKPSLSHISSFHTGAIPVYMGADNIDDYLPGLRSAIKVCV